MKEEADQHALPLSQAHERVASGAAVLQTSRADVTTLLGIVHWRRAAATIDRGSSASSSKLSEGLLGTDNPPQPQMQVQILSRALGISMGDS
jgi:hypothetical protein